MKSIILTFTLTLLGLSAAAQVAVGTSGGNATGSGGSVSYSVGQVVYTTAKSSAGSMIQGVQQPYEISIVSGSPETPGIQLNFNAYPNPTGDILTLSVENPENTELVYQLLDLKGKVLETKNIKDSKTTIDMRFYAQAVYLLRISEKHPTASGPLKIFQIIKR